MIEPVQATTADGLILRGELARGDDSWVALLHDVGEDIDVWRGLRKRLIARGWTVLALDLRGHGGSDGPEPWVPERAELDVDLAVVLARRAGARHVCILAAGTAGLLALRGVQRALGDERLELPDSLALISPGPLGGANPMQLRGEGVPKLILYGSQDPLAGEARAIQRASIGWTVGVTFATSARGSALASEWEAEVADKLVGFLTEQISLPSLGNRRAERRDRR